MCMEVLDAGITVLSTMNIQHVESLTPTVLDGNRNSGARNRAGLGDAPRR